MTGLIRRGIALLCLGHALSAQATILDDFNNGTIVTDFLFNDAAGTQMPATFNSAPGGGSFDVDTDNDDVVTNGSGQLDASDKANTDFGTNYVDIAGLNAGRVISLFDVSWAFEESIYDPTEDEEFRLSLITFDPRSTFVTAETYFTRTSASLVSLYGNAVGTGAVDTSAVLFGSSGRLLTLMDVDLTSDSFELFYSLDLGASFLSVGTGLLDPTRGIESVRLVTNEDYSDDSLLIDRVAVSVIGDPNTVPVPATLLVLLAGLAGLRAANFSSGQGITYMHDV